jgi:putative hydrolase of the HAD superfamily
MLKAVLFDEPVGHTYARIARKHGLHADDAAVSAGFRGAFGSTPGLAFGPGRRADEIRQLEREWWYGLVRKSFEGLGEFASFDAFFEELFTYFGDPTSWTPLPDAHSVLQRLRDNDLKLGIISNFDARLYRILEGLDLRRFFDTVTISSEAGYAKPAGRIFASALAALGVASGEAVHIGDSEQMDVRGAQDAGLRAILIDTGTIAEPEIDREVARVSSLAQMIEVMRLLRFT